MAQQSEHLQVRADGEAVMEELERRPLGRLGQGVLSVAQRLKDAMAKIGSVLSSIDPRIKYGTLAAVAACIGKGEMDTTRIGTARSASMLEDFAASNLRPMPEAVNDGIAGPCWVGPDDQFHWTRISGQPSRTQFMRAPFSISSDGTFSLTANPEEVPVTVGADELPGDLYETPNRIQYLFTGQINSPWSNRIRRDGELIFDSSDLGAGPTFSGAHPNGDLLLIAPDVCHLSSSFDGPTMTTSDDFFANATLDPDFNPVHSDSAQDWVPSRVVFTGDGEKAFLTQSCVRLNFLDCLDPVTRRPSSEQSSSDIFLLERNPSTGHYDWQGANTPKVASTVDDEGASCVVESQEELCLVVDSFIDGLNYACSPKPPVTPPDAGRVIPPDLGVDTSSPAPDARIIVSPDAGTRPLDLGSTPSPDTAQTPDAGGVIPTDLGIDATPPQPDHDIPPSPDVGTPDSRPIPTDDIAIGESEAESEGETPDVTQVHRTDGGPEADSRTTETEMPMDHPPGCSCSLHGQSRGSLEKWMTLALAAVTFRRKKRN